jgi:hypothetical protein
MQEVVVSEEEYEREMAFLEQLLGALHNQINAIADREASAAMAQHPTPYTNPQLTATKERLVKVSRGIIDKMEVLHEKWTTP